MSTPIWVLSLLALVSFGILYMGHRFQVYSRSGMLVSAIIIVIVTASKGWAWAVPLIVFIGAQVYWSLMGISSEQKAQASRQNLSGVAVASRLCWPTAMAAAQLFLPEFSLFPIFIGSLSVATADVWATEIGLLSKDKPRLLTSKIPVPPGTPGAISTLGLVASLGGGWLIGLVGLLTSSLPMLASQQYWPQDRLWLPLAATIGGFVGMLVDSILAQTAQAMYYCNICKRFSQQETDSEGHPAEYVRGIGWITDETIDLISTIVGALITALCLKMLN